MCTEKIAVSIIVPIYNIQDYVVDCINSIIAQTFIGKIEVLLIDDCCKDNSISLIQNLLSKYTGNITFKIIKHETNKGLSAARNTGIEHATGTYIYFLDGDDYIYPHCIEKLVNSIEQEQEIDMP
jgi:glycosyltransferase involved in cell wall biosynthesis